MQTTGTRQQKHGIASWRLQTFRIPVSRSLSGHNGNDILAPGRRCVYRRLSLACIHWKLLPVGSLYPSDTSLSGFAVIRTSSTAVWPAGAGHASGSA